MLCGKNIYAVRLYLDVESQQNHSAINQSALFFIIKTIKSRVEIIHVVIESDCLDNSFVIVEQQ